MLKISMTILFMSCLSGPFAWSEEKVIKKWIDMSQEEKDSKNSEWLKSWEIQSLNADPAEQELLEQQYSIREKYKNALKAGNEELADEFLAGLPCADDLG